MAYKHVIAAVPDLLGHWRVGEASGSSAAEETGTYTGTYSSVTHGATSLLTGDSDTAMGCASGAYAYMRAAAPPPGAGSYTVLLWVSRTVVDAIHGLAHQADMWGGRSLPAWAVTVSAGNRLRIGVTDGSGVETWLTSATSMASAGATYMVAAVIDRDANLLRLYINGAADANTQSIATVGTISAAGDVGFGYWIYGGASDPLYGVIDEPSVFDRALSATEIAAIHARGMGPVSGTLASPATPSGSGTKATTVAAATITSPATPSGSGTKATVAAATITSPATPAGSGWKATTVAAATLLSPATPSGSGVRDRFTATSDADWIECWVTTPGQAYIAHLDRSVPRSPGSPFRAFGFSVERNAPGAGSLEYATPNAILTANPTLFDPGNLVWMRYRGKTVTWIIEQVTARLGGEEVAWTQVSGRGALQLLGDRLVWPDGFDEDSLDPSVWAGPGISTTTLAQAADDGDEVLVVEPVCTDGGSVERWREGQKVIVYEAAVGTDTSHIRRMRLRDDGDWALTLKRPVTNDYSVAATVSRQIAAFIATTLTVAVVAGKRRIHVESAKRLHPGARLHIASGIVAEHAIVRDVEHTRAKDADTATLAAAANSGQKVAIISGRHFKVGETVTLVGGTNETAVIAERRLHSASPVQWRLRFAVNLAYTHASGTDVTRAAVGEDWVITLRRPLQSSYPIGADVTRPSDQWRTVVGQAAGEMLEELVTDSNGRSTTAIAIGTIEVAPDDGDQWTQRFRFDDLGDVVTDVTNAYGDVTMAGLELSYWNELGTDRSATVIFEEGLDILRVERDVDHREAVTWVVAEGVGEGVRAKLAVAEDATATRRREAYVDAHDATNLPMLEAAADAALAENGARDSMALDVAETRFAAFTDYDLGDWIRAVAQSRGIDETARVVAIYVKEENEQVRVSIDVNSPRTEWLLELERGERASKRTLGVHGRQPQGQLVPLTFSGSGVFDDSAAGDLEVMFDIPDRLFLIVEARVKVQLRRFWATAKSAAGGGSSTETSASSSAASSGSSSSSTTGSDGADTRTSSTKAATSPTSDGSAHHHVMFYYQDSGVGSETRREYWAGGDLSTVYLEVDTASDLETANESVGGHTHDVTIGAHSHTVDIPNHTHGMAHTHGISHTHDVTLSSHTHGLVYGIYREPMPTQWEVRVYVDQLDAETWTNVWTSGNIVDPDTFWEQDLSAIVTEPGSWRIRVKSNAAPDDTTWRDGRLGADVWGSLVAAMGSEG